MSRIIFIDFDGVLVPFEKKAKKRRPAVVSLEAVVCLNTVIRKTEAKLVVTSSWGKSSSMEKLAECLGRWGVIGEVVGKSCINNKPRGIQILDWLDCTPEFLRPIDPIESYAILDDLGVLEIPDANLVQIPDPTLRAPDARGAEGDKDIGGQDKCCVSVGVGKTQDNRSGKLSLADLSMATNLGNHTKTAIYITGGGLFGSLSMQRLLHAGLCSNMFSLLRQLLGALFLQVSTFTMQMEICQITGIT